jgi:hypothetical protein
MRWRSSFEVTSATRGMIFPFKCYYQFSVFSSPGDIQPDASLPLSQVSPSCGQQCTQSPHSEPTPMKCLISPHQQNVLRLLFKRSVHNPIPVPPPVTTATRSLTEKSWDTSNWSIIIWNSFFEICVGLCFESLCCFERMRIGDRERGCVGEMGATN